MKNYTNYFEGNMPVELALQARFETQVKEILKMFPTHRIYLNSFRFPTVGTGPGDVVQISRLAGILQNYVLLSVGGGGGQMQTGADVSCAVCSASSPCR